MNYFILTAALAFSSMALAMPKDYQPVLPSYKSCMDIFHQEKRLMCLEKRIEGLQALSLQRNGANGAETTHELSIKECGNERSTDSLLCRIRVIDYWIH